jgi:hypothetical protein
VECLGSGAIFGRIANEDFCLLHSLITPLLTCHLI